MREFTRVKTVLFIALCDVMNSIKYGDMTKEVINAQADKKKKIEAIESDYDKVITWLSDNAVTHPEWEAYVSRLGELEAKIQALEREPVRFSGLDEVSMVTLRT